MDQSTEQEVRDTLKTLPFIDQATLHEGTTPWHEDPEAKFIWWGYLNQRNGGGALLANGKLKMIDMAINYSLTLRSVVDQLGRPDFAGYGPAQVPDHGCTIMLGWREKKIAAVFSDDGNRQPCDAIRQSRGVAPELQVTVLFYLVEEGFGPGLGPPRGEPIPWPGFSNP